MSLTSSHAEQDYLKTIYELTRWKKRATTNDIAGTLGFSAASVTGMLKKLAGITPPLVDYRKRAGARLTPEGSQQALEVIRHHRLLETFLHEILGYEWDEVHEEAERLEHAISEEMEARIAKLLGYPTHDPHGAPIPSLELEMPATSYQALSALRPPQQAIIRQVDDRNAGLLRYLTEKGLQLGAVIDVIDYSPYDHNLTLKIAGQVDPVTVGLSISKNILVDLH